MAERRRLVLVTGQMVLWLSLRGCLIRSQAPSIGLTDSLEAWHFAKETRERPRPWNLRSLHPKDGGTVS